MNENIEKELRFKSVDFWKGEMEKAGILDEVGPFEYIAEAHTPPGLDSEYKETRFKNIFLNGKKTDIYRAEGGNGKTTWITLYLHIKE